MNKTAIEWLRMFEPMRRKKPTRIFAGSMSDLFQDAVTDDQLDQVLDGMADCPQHTFYLLIKPPFIFRRALPCNVWLGATVTGTAIAKETEQYMAAVARAGSHTFVLVEPLLSYVNPAWLWPFEWWIIGAMTGPQAVQHRPQREWVDELIACADDDHVPVFLKDSISKLWPDLTRQEWPQSDHGCVTCRFGTGGNR